MVSLKGKKGLIASGALRRNAGGAFQEAAQTPRPAKTLLQRSDYIEICATLSTQAQRLYKALKQMPLSAKLQEKISKDLDNRQYSRLAILGQRVHKYYSQGEEQKIDPLAEIYGASGTILREISDVVEANRALIKKTARKFTQRKFGLEDTDLVQEGVFGVIRAIETFDPNMACFSTHALPEIRQKIQRAIENTGRTIRIPVYMQCLTQNLGRELQRHYAQTGSEMTEQEILETADVPKLTPKNYALYQGTKPPIRLSSRSTRFGAEGYNLADSIPASSAEPQALSRNRLFEDSRLGRAWMKLTGEERRIIEFHTGARGNEMTHTEIGLSRERPVSRERIRQIKDKALNKMRKSLAHGPQPELLSP